MRPLDHTTYRRRISAVLTEVEEDQLIAIANDKGMGISETIRHLVACEAERMAKREARRRK